MTGNTEPVCPYCSKTFDKMPGRKRKCLACGKLMYVRTRPVDRQRVLVTEQGAKDIDEEWAAIHAKQRLRRFVDAEEFENEKAVLALRFGLEPADNDVMWALHNKHLVEHASANNWGLYRNTRLAMAELLLTEDKRRQALDTYLEVAYLDANGPNNLSGPSDPGFLRQSPPFSAGVAFMAPGIVAEIRMLAEKLGIADTHLRLAFLAVAEGVQWSLKLPVAPDEGWQHFLAAGMGASQ